MTRLALLSFAVAVILAGFAAPFFIDGVPGLILCVLVVLSGSTLLWIIEKKTASSLDKDNRLNDILNTQDGPE